VAVVGYRYWQQRFNLDPAIVGKSLKLNNVPVTVIGVAPPGFSGTLQVGDSPDVYIPMASEPLFAAFASSSDGSALPKPDYWFLQIMGRVRPGVGFAQVRGNMEAAFRETAKEAIQEEQGVTLQIVSGNQGLQSSRDTFFQPLQILLFIIALVLLIACVNVANLLLARGTAREREMATRLSIGATRRRLLRQLVTESVLLSCLGGSLGAVLAYWGKDLVVKWGPWATQEQVTAEVDLRVLGFALGISVLTGVLFGLLPALRATRSDLSSMLGQHSRTISAARSRLTRSLLVVQVGMALVLLVGAGFFVQTLWKLKHVDVGFNTTNLMLFKVDPSLNRYPPAQFVNTVERIVERLQTIDGVQAATVSSNALIADGGNFGNRNGSEISASMLATRWNFFDAMGVPVVAGRSFTSHDDSLAQKVVMVNEALVRTYFPNTDPIGKAVWNMEIVGVVRDTKITSVRRTTPPAVFSPYVQERPRRMTFQVRFTGEPNALISKIREVVRQVDSNVPIFEIRPMNDQLDRVLSQSRLFANFGAAFGVLALFLVCVGLYGTMSYSVTRRTHEIGIRLALGAKRSDVRLMVMRETLVLVAFGMTLGLAGAFALAQQIQSLLFGLQPNDPTTIGVAVGVMTLIAALAGYLPARRASKVDPVVALRYE
jgi:predicted permease